MDKEKPRHLWVARFSIAIVMLLFGIIGLIMTDISQDYAWNYWSIMVPVYAILSLWLGWYLRYKKQKMTFVSIWQEILHWAGLLLAVYLVYIILNAGMIGRFQAGLVVLTLLSLTTYLAGVYTDITFIPVGILLGLFVAGAAIMTDYLYVITIPLTLIVVILLWFLVRNKPKGNDLNSG